MKKICFNVKEDGFYGTYWPLKEKIEYAFIACIGDDANDYLARTVVKWLHKQGFNVLTMSPNKKDYGHHNYPLERIEMAIHYLKNYGNSKIGIIGASTTGTLALTVASMFKDISLTIALTPSDFIWQGFKQGKKDGCKEWPIKNESLNSSPSFNSIGKNVRLNLQVNNILIVENIVEVKMSKAMNASVVYLNSNNVNISTGSSTNTFDNNGVNWLV